MSLLRQYLPEKGPDSVWHDERKTQLQSISTIRKRAIIVYAARLAPALVPLPVGINYADLLPFQDLLEDLSGDSVDVILETPGGDGVVARDLVELLHAKFKHVTFIIPGWAKSAGTIMALGGDEILMGPLSALGPIDAQLVFEGKQFSADALLEGMKAIKDEAAAAPRLNPAFIPILQRISPGDLQHAQNALDFAKETVAEWLRKYKFRSWTHHRTNNPGTPVTDDQKAARADEIAQELCRHSKWKVHGRSLRLPDLRDLRLEIVDYSQQRDLCEAIQRYYTLLRLMLDSGNAFKIIETVAAKVIQRFNIAQGQQPSGTPQPPAGATSAAASAVVEAKCAACSHVTKVQANFAPGQPLEPGAVPYPANDELVCQGCGNKMNLRPVRDQLERQVGPVIA